MARLRLRYEDTHRDALPNLCMKCGQPATTHLRKTFSWFPQWVFVLIFVGLLPYLIVAMVLTKRMSVDVPLCDRHTGHWWKRQIIIFAPLVLVVGMLMAAVVSFEEKLEDIGGFACAMSVFLIIAQIIVIAIVQAGTIKPAEITDDTIDLIKVHDDFVAAFEDGRPRPRRRRRDLDDDDDFDQPRRRAATDEERRESFREDRDEPPPRRRPKPEADPRDTFRADPGDD